LASNQVRLGVVLARVYFLVYCFIQMVFRIFGCF